jgi:hypothetical protein
MFLWKYLFKNFKNNVKKIKILFGEINYFTHVKI